MMAMIMQPAFIELLLSAGHMLKGLDISLDTDLPVQS